MNAWGVIVLPYLTVRRMSLVTGRERGKVCLYKLYQTIAATSGQSIHTNFACLYFPRSPPLTSLLFDIYSLLSHNMIIFSVAFLQCICTVCCWLCHHSIKQFPIKFGTVFFGYYFPKDIYSSRSFLSVYSLIK